MARMIRHGIDPQDDIKSIDVDEALTVYEKCCLDDIRNSGDEVTDKSVTEFIDKYLPNTKESLGFFYKSEERTEMRIECLGNVLRCKLNDNDCIESDKEKISGKLEDLAAKGVQNAADNLFDIIIEDNAEEKGRYNGYAFNQLMKMEWFAKKVNTDYPQPTGRIDIYEERSYSAKRRVSLNLCTYLKRFPQSQLVEEISMHRILHQRDINLGGIMTRRLMERKEYGMAFKVCSHLFHKPDDSPYDYMAAEFISLMLGYMYEYGIGTRQDLQKAIYYYKLCYESLQTDCAYYLGRCYEKLGDDIKAMKYYKEIIADGKYRETSYQRNEWDSERKRNKFNSIPYRLEISFRRLKKKMHPNRHDILEITGVSLLKIFTMELHVLMNSTITVDWGNGKIQTEKWKVNGWHFIGHEYSYADKTWNINITSDEENVIMRFRPLTAYSLESINFDRCKGLMYLICPNQSLKYLDLRGLPYLREVNVHGNVLSIFSVNGLHNLTALDVSNNPIEFYNLSHSKVPLRLLSTRGTPLCYNARMDIRKQMELELGHIIGPFCLKEQDDLIFDYQNNVRLYPQMQKYLRDNQPPLLAVWGKNDPSFIPAGAEAFKRDLPKAIVKFVDSGHFALESHHTEIAAMIKEFLNTVY